LVVEDNDLVARAVSRALRAHFHRIVVVRSGEEAIDELQATAFDAVLADHDLASEMTGAQLLDEVGSRWPSARRVLHTGRIDFPPCDAHVVVLKPATAQQLVTALTSP